MTLGKFPQYINIVGFPVETFHAYINIIGSDPIIYTIWKPQSLSPTETELEMIYAVLKIDDPDSIDIVEFQAIDRVKNNL